MLNLKPRFTQLGSHLLVNEATTTDLAMATLLGENVEVERYNYYPQANFARISMVTKYKSKSRIFEVAIVRLANGKVDVYPNIMTPEQVGTLLEACDLAVEDVIQENITNGEMGA